MNVRNEDLTAGECGFLERQQAAATEGVTVAEYYRSHGLTLKSLHATQKQLVSKGLLPAARLGRPPSEPKATKKWTPVRQIAECCAMRLCFVPYCARPEFTGRRWGGCQ
jgi:hypothetical protein